jgi:endoglycosylceramidase
MKKWKLCTFLKNTAKIIFIASLTFIEIESSALATAKIPELDNIPQKAMTLRDRQDRHVIYRGINARVKGVFDVSFGDGRKPLENIPEFTAADLIKMKEIGFNFLRLPVNWSGIAPTPNGFNKAYIDKIIEILDLCDEYDVDVLLDMHQDAYSKEIGEDGAPDWAIFPKGYEENKGGHLGNLTLKRISLDTQRAFASFWKNKRVKGKRLWEHYTDATLFLLKHTANHPAVAGLQIMNEPWLLHIIRMFPDDIYTEGVKIEMLWDFYKYSVDRIRKRHKSLWIYIEPDVSKSAAVPILTNDDQLFKATGLPKTAPWKTDRTVYAPHLYTLGMTLDGLLGTKLDPLDPGIKTSIEYSLVEAEQIKAPFMIGEFGFSNKSRAYKETLSNILDFADKYMFHTAQWVWKESSQGSWGFWDYNETTQKYIFRQKAGNDTARAYPANMSGTMDSYKHNNDTKKLTIEMSEISGNATHKVIWPINYGYSRNPKVFCGTSLISHKMNRFGDVTFKCTEKSITIREN